MPPIIGVPVLAILLAAGLICWARRLEAGRRLVRLVLIAFALRVALAVGLYLVSYWRVPVLGSLQHPEVRGFWMFGPDAFFFHHAATRIMEDWVSRRAVMDPYFGADFYLMVAVLYTALGRCPLYPILVNGFLASASGLLAYRIGHRLFGRAAAEWSAVVVMFWPSSMIWSAQLLKDPPCWFLVLLALSLMLALLPGAASPSGRRRAGWLGLLGGLVLATVLLTRLRDYLGVALAVSATLAALIGLRWALRKAGPAGAGQLVSVALIMWGAVWVAKAVDPRSALLYIQWEGVVGSRLVPDGRGEWVPDPAAAPIPHPHPEDVQPVEAAPGTPSAPETAASAPAPAKTLAYYREGFLRNQGHSVLDTDVRFRRRQDLVRYAPRALVIALFAPFPTQWFEAGGSTGIMRSLASVEMLLIYALFPGFVIGLWRLLKARRIEGLVVGGFIAVMLVALGLTVNTLGVLFRLRLPAILLMGLVAGGALESRYGRLMAAVRQRIMVSLWRMKPCVGS